MGFSRQESWSGLPCPPPGDFPTQGWNPSLLCLLHWQAGSFTTGTTWEALWTLAAAAKSLQSCRTLCNPIDGSPPDSPSLGFSRQEHWSGLPFPSQCRKVKSESEVAQSCPTLSDPMDCSPPGSSAHGIFQARVLEWVAIAFSSA